MSIFTKMQKDSAEKLYEREIKPTLQEKDGNEYILLIKSFSKFFNQNFTCDDKYTTQLNQIIKYMRDDGYEIVDIRLNSFENTDTITLRDSIHTLIIYK